MIETEITMIDSLPTIKNIKINLFDNRQIPQKMNQFQVGYH